MNCERMGKCMKCACIGSICVFICLFGIIVYSLFVLLDGTVYCASVLLLHRERVFQSSAMRMATYTERTMGREFAFLYCLIRSLISSTCSA